MDQKKIEDQEQTKEKFRSPLHLQNARMIKGKKWENAPSAWDGTT